MSFILALLALPKDGFLIDHATNSTEGTKEALRFARKWTGEPAHHLTDDSMLILTGVTEGNSMGATILVSYLAWRFFRDKSIYRRKKAENDIKKIEGRKKAAGKDGAAINRGRGADGTLGARGNKTPRSAGNAAAKRGKPKRREHPDTRRKGW